MEGLTRHQIIIIGSGIAGNAAEAAAMIAKLKQEIPCVHMLETAIEAISRIRRPPTPDFSELVLKLERLTDVETLINQKPKIISNPVIPRIRNTHKGFTYNRNKFRAHQRK